MVKGTKVVTLKLPFCDIDFKLRIKKQDPERNFDSLLLPAQEIQVERPASVRKFYIRLSLNSPI